MRHITKDVFYSAITTTFILGLIMFITGFSGVYIPLIFLLRGWLLFFLIITPVLLINSYIIQKYKSLKGIEKINVGGDKIRQITEEEFFKKLQLLKKTKIDTKNSNSVLLEKIVKRHEKQPLHRVI